METLNGKLLNAKVVPSRKEQRQSPILMKLNVVSEKIFDTYFFIFLFFLSAIVEEAKTTLIYLGNYWRYNFISYFSTTNLMVYTILLFKQYIKEMFFYKFLPSKC